jgi:hypothetical protein
MWKVGQVSAMIPANRRTCAAHLINEAPFLARLELNVIAITFNVMAVTFFPATSAHRTHAISFNTSRQYFQIPSSALPVSWVCIWWLLFNLRSRTLIS